jgi:hypothetical protein
MFNFLQTSRGVRVTTRLAGLAMTTIVYTCLRMPSQYD